MGADKLYFQILHPTPKHPLMFYKSVSLFVIKLFRGRDHLLRVRSCP